MSELTDLSCAIYVNAELSVDALATLVSSALSASLSDPTFAPIIQTTAGEVEVRKNDGWDAARAIQFPDGFLFFRYRLEFYAEAKVPLGEQARTVSRMLTALWSQGIAAVAACDYEDELPRKGGYKELTVPWPSGHRVPPDGEDMSSLPQSGAVQP